MDPGMLIPMITPIVHAVATYLHDEAAKKAGSKAAEIIGEKAATGAVNVGARAFTSLRAWFTKTGDVKTQRVLDMVELDPEDADMQEKLIKETARVARDNPKFEQELRFLAGQVPIAQPGSINQTFSNYASNQGVQGIINGPVTLNPNEASS